MHTLIYCDIDGVLHRWPCKVEEMFNSVCIGLLDRTLRDRNVGIVITSTWRLEWPLETLTARLGPLGPRVVGVTPEIEDPFVHHTRYQEVLSHWNQQDPTPARWVAIDDEPGRYPTDLPNLILTNPATGLQRTDIAILEQLLNPDSPM